MSKTTDKIMTQRESDDAKGQVQRGLCRFRQGDCLQVMPELPARSVDAVVTDPPYMIGAISAGNAKAKSGTWADMENSGYWFAAWFEKAQRVLKQTGYLVTFCNWRSLPTFIFALSQCKMPATSCMVWDKDWIGPAGPAQLRPRYELALFSAMPDATIDDRSAADVQKCKWMAGNSKTTVHPAEKPVELLRRLVCLSSPPGGTVLDPFMGSGSTGVAAVRQGREFVGIERNREWFDLAKSRVEGEAAQTRMFDAA